MKILKIMLCVAFTALLMASTIGATLPFQSPICIPAESPECKLPWKPEPGLSPIVGEPVSIWRGESKEAYSIDVDTASHGECIARARTWMIDEAMCK